MRPGQWGRVAVLVSMLGLVLLNGKHQPATAQVASCQHSISFDSNGMEQLQLTCDTVRQTSWSDWLSGNSYSTQFHFIDLLELINRLQSGHDAE